MCAMTGAEDHVTAEKLSMIVPRHEGCRHLTPMKSGKVRTDLMILNTTRE